MKSEPLARPLQIGLLACVWLLGFVALFALNFSFGGTFVELFKGMNLKLPLATKLFFTATAPLRIGGMSGVLSLVWTGVCGLLLTRSKELSAATFLGSTLLAFGVIQTVMLFSFVVAWLPLYKLIGNLG